MDRLGVSPKRGWRIHSRIAAVALFVVAPGACPSSAETPPSPGSLPPAELERLLRRPFRIADVEPIDEGRTGAMRMEIEFPPEERDLVVKWKRAPAGGDGWNRSPRRELAAYEVQKWFLDPGDFVVPPTAVVCIPLDVYRTVDSSPDANLAGARCVLGTIAVWLDDVRTPDPLYDPDRFAAEPRYAAHLARYNLLTHLIDNRDTRAGNQLASADEDDRRIYSVDNGISFGEWLHNPFRSHWNVIRVPALPRAAIERLRALDPRRMDALAVVAEFRRDRAGVFREQPPGPPLSAGEGVRAQADVLQIGLTSAEIDGIRDRVRSLLDAAEDGDLDLFD
jgi:hypothetical protein